jgi:predicted nucleic acid-binding protein
MSILLPDEECERSQEILESGRYSPVVPFLWFIEVGNVLVTAVRKKRISPEIQSLLITSLKKIDIRINEHECSIERIISLATDYHLTAYDAVYLDLALHTGFPLATHDRDLKTAAQKASVAVV